MAVDTNAYWNGSAYVDKKTGQVVSVNNNAYTGNAYVDNNIGQAVGPSTTVGGTSGMKAAPAASMAAPAAQNGTNTMAQSLTQPSTNWGSDITGNQDSRAVGNALTQLGALQGQNILGSGAQAIQDQANAGMSAPINSLSAYLSSMGTSAFAIPQAPTLPTSAQYGIADPTDWQSVQSQVQSAVGAQANLGNAQQLQADRQALTANMAGRGMTGSSIDTSGQVGLQNLQSILGAQANAQGLQAGITAGQTQLGVQNQQYQQMLNTLTQQYGLSAEQAQQMLSTYQSGLGDLSSLSGLGYNQANLGQASNIISQGGNLIAGQQAQEISSSPVGQIGSILSGIGSLIP